MPPRIVLDLSRLLSRVLHPTPSGIDRVEMAYARGLLAAAPDRLRFAAVHPTGWWGRLPTDRVLRFLDDTERAWELTGGRAPRRTAAARLFSLRPRPVPAEPGPAVYLQASPHHLTRPALVRRILGRERARFVCLVHDLIPLEYPEYARPGGAALHRRRVETVATLADGVLANSHATLASLQPWLAAAGRLPLTAVAHLGTWSAPAAPPPDPAAPPYFLCLGTIEPRKNHLLLLHLWRDLAARRAGGGAALPRLVLVGRRGWENEQVVDLLERCPGLRGHVDEHPGLPDDRLRALLAGARALLLPSFAEGFGMPVAEALDAGVPVICSDLPALREVGGDVPDYLHPLDGLGWERAVADYAAADSPRRAAQLRRIAGWRRPDWRAHIGVVLDMADRVASIPITDHPDSAGTAALPSRPA